MNLFLRAHRQALLDPMIKPPAEALIEPPRHAHTEAQTSHDLNGPSWQACDSRGPLQAPWGEGLTAGEFESQLQLWRRSQGT